MQSTIENKVINLEKILAKFITQTNYAINSLHQEMKEFREESERDRKKRDQEMKEFKDEMKEFKDEMKEFKDEMRGFKGEMIDFKDGVDEFKSEMSRFREESERDWKRLNKQMGEIANKQGKVVEDLIAPAVRPAIEKYFDEDVIDFSVNRKKHIKELKLKGEFDVIAISKTAVYLVEVKSAPRPEHLTAFKNNIETFRKLFPDYNHLKIVPIFATIRFDDDFIPKVTNAGFYALAYREWDFVDILNFDEMKM